MKRPLTFIFAVGLAAAVATYAISRDHQHGSAAAPAPVHSSPAATPPHSVTAPRAKPRLGVFEPGVPLSYKPVTRFGALTGIKPAITLYYGGWGDRFWTTFDNQAADHGALPFVQINPGQVTMAAVASGQEDSYIRYYADAARRFGKPIIIGFAAEPNGSWYRWGSGHTRPSVWIAAWRHLIKVFRHQGARNVIWLWTVSSTNLAGAPIARWWPGADWVNWVGIDGYYYRRSDSFATVFGKTVNEVRKFTHDPILISETAVGPVSGPSKIADLFAGVRKDHLLGLVWFDEAQHRGLYHQDWRLKDSPRALAAFRKAAVSLRKGPTQ